MKAKILLVVRDLGPKHFSRRIKNTPPLWRWITSRTPDFDEDKSISERIYLALTLEDSKCEIGNNRKFKSFDEGYGFCGPTGKCECARKVVSQKVSNAKQTYSDERNAEINKKRRQTVLEEYGVEYSVQTDAARQAHKEFYEDEEKVQQAIETQKNTLNDKYGPDINNARDIPGVNNRIIKTTQERYGVDNAMQNNNVKEQSLQTRKKNEKPGQYIEGSYFLLAEKFLTKYNIEFLTSVDEYFGVSEQRYYDFRCLLCGHEFSTYIDNGHIPCCHICNPKEISYKSKEELELFDFIVYELELTAENGNKSIINPYELDIVIPEKKIALEYCGLFWHSHFSSGKDKAYHQKKMFLAHEKGYQLITIFSDEWIFKKHIVKNRLRHILGENNQTVYARKTEIKDISSRQANDFYEMYHIQGKCRAKYHLGLFYNNILVAAMSLGDLRKTLNQKPIKDYYELIRFSTSDVSVIGGASRLFKYFIRKINPENVISYCDRRWSIGNLYNQIGFNLVRETDPGFWYVEKHFLRHHRSKFQKHIILENFDGDQTKTEIENMVQMGYDIIYDCGQLKFEWNRQIGPNKVDK